MNYVSKASVYRAQQRFSIPMSSSAPQSIDDIATGDERYKSKYARWFPELGTFVRLKAFCMLPFTVDRDVYSSGTP